MSDLIGHIYDAALDPELWPSVLEQFCAYVPGSMGNLFSQDIHGKANRYYSWGDNPEFVDSYLRHYAPLNPVFPGAIRFTLLEPFTGADILPFGEMRETRYYREWLEPQGFIDFVGCNIEKTASRVVPLAIVRHERDGFADDGSRWKIGLLAPHVRRAVLIGGMIDHGRVQADAFAEAIDGLATGVFLVDASGLLIHANLSGRAMLDDGDPVQVVQGRLSVGDEALLGELRSVFATAAEGGTAIGSSGVAVPIKGETGPFVAHVLPLTSGSRRRAAMDRATVAALFIREASIDVPAAINAAEQLYGLTPAEARVLRALIEVGGVSEIAAVLGSARSTVKRHLEHLFLKTGARGHRELIKLIAGFDSPVQSDAS